MLGTLSSSTAVPPGPVPPFITCPSLANMQGQFRRSQCILSTPSKLYATSDLLRSPFARFVSMAQIQNESFELQTCLQQLCCLLVLCDSNSLRASWLHSLVLAQIGRGLEINILVPTCVTQRFAIRLSCLHSIVMSASLCKQSEGA